jgi:hypothetical protein
LTSVDFFIDQSVWGFKVLTTVGSVNGSPLKILDSLIPLPGIKLYTDILKHIPGISSLGSVQGGFGMSGSMTGNGLPVAVTFYSGTNSNVRDAWIL